MIRILANLYKRRGDTSPVLTAADFRLDDDSSGIGALLDSVSNEHHRTLRAKAQQNIIAVKEAVPAHSALAPHLAEIVGALWLRSIAVGNLAGAEPGTLQVDITRSKRLDDNQYQVELSTIIENSFNIHQEGNRLVFKEEENPRAKLMACARNDKLFADGSDQFQLARQIRYVIGGTDEVARSSRVIVLPKSWQSDPWSMVEESELPDRWDERLPILVLPEEPDNIDVRLGHWIKDHLQKRRNTIRFLLPKSGSVNAFQDRDLLVLTRAEMKANEWSNQNPEYRKLHNEYQSILRDHLKKRFDRFAILSQWNFSDPSQCRFSIETLGKQGSQIPEGIEEVIVNDLFVPEEFEELCVSAASESTALGKLLKELQEPRPTGQECIPWLGETAMKEKALRLCARGKIAINVRGLDLLQSEPGEDEDAAWKRLRPRLAYTGRQLDEVFLLAPSATPSTGGSSTEPTSAQNPGGTGVLFDPHTARPPVPAEKPAPSAPGTSPSGGGIFGGSSDSGSRRRVTLNNPATSPLNLIGKLEGWGIGPATRVSDVSIKVSDATGDQLKELLKKLPDGMTFELSLEKEETQ